MQPGQDPLGEDRRPTALMLYSGGLSQLIWTALDRHRLRLPSALSIVTWGGERPSTVGLPLATVHVPWTALGEQAMELLRRRLAGEPSQPTLRLPLAFSPGMSLAPPPS